MAFTVAEFRSNFDEFSDEIHYPDSIIELLISVTEEFFNEETWGNKLDFARQIYVAHYLQLKNITSQTQNGIINTIDVKDELVVKFNATIEDGLTSTYYGRILKQLIKQKGYSLSCFVRPKGILSGAP